MKVTFFKDSSGHARWRLRARNGRVVADSAEGYRTVKHAVEMAEKIFGDGVNVVRPPQRLARNGKLTYCSLP